ncbi:MAG TPA: polynucleotide adenylyltransferase PcnB [Gammaproteobacteria bacterium]|nr:polynucleotide adenylyltransferase PcnB [Gammaproteobacteria bacterium]
MIPAFLAGRNHGSLFNDTDRPSRVAPVIVPREQHNLSRANISPNALKVLYRLRSAGFEAFLVGGGVRDLLLDRHPKDFDVVTNADPDQIQDVFRNCRLIGRRFRLAHVRFGRDIVEVATFRAAGAEPDDDERAHTDSGRILRDNVYGTIGEDVWRRDFTVNALYYNIADFSIWDYVNGVADVRARTLRLIGDPAKRYREDPVRMLRAMRFAAKLDFTLAPEAAAPIASLGRSLADVPPARLFDELLKLFLSGYAVRSFELLLQHDLLRYLFRDTAALLETDERDKIVAFVRKGLSDTDKRVREDKPVTPMFLYALFLWFPIQALARRLASEGWNEGQALLEASQRIVASQQTAFPRRFSSPMKELLNMQWRFAHRHGARAARLLEHKRFRAAYDFLVLRASCGEVDQETVTWWTEIQNMPREEQSKLLNLQRPGRRRRGGRRRSARHHETNDVVV